MFEPTASRPASRCEGEPRAIDVPAGELENGREANPPSKNSQPLWPFQADVIARIKAEMLSTAALVLLVIPTGGGKTVTAAQIISYTVAHGHRVLILVHRRELLLQMSRKLHALGVDHADCRRLSHTAGNRGPGRHDHDLARQSPAPAAEATAGSEAMIFDSEFEAEPGGPGLDDLAALPLWVKWRYEGPEDNPTKVPYRASAPAKPLGWHKAKSNDPNGWRPRDEVLLDGFSGLGIMFGPVGSLRLGGVDLDMCIDPDGKVEPWAREILDLANTYSEISPSGRGIKAYFFHDPAVTQADGRRWRSEHVGDQS